MTGSDLPRMEARDAAQGWAEEEGAAVGTPRPPSSGSERAGSDELLGQSGLATETSQPVALRRFCDHFLEHPTDEWGGTYCKLIAGHGGEHSAHYPTDNKEPARA